MNTIARIQSRGTFTIPKKIRDVLDLSNGDMLNVNLKNKKIVIEPIKTDKSLQKDILNSLEDIKKGDFISFSSAKEMRKKIS
ncbi:MAG: AbrB/MazE/SpoVT family DNA-binding domain-containing protein [Candidatus Pacebacteria bacterium]|nr:AbrB/MazE/SpoVT family DNA-binding domain-containing protein [Candidatus Paceibacterota bacterium]